MVISPPIRVLYRIIGMIIGKQVFNRILNDDNLDPDPKQRREMARLVIDTISSLRKEVASSRSFDNLEIILNKLNDKGSAVSVKLLAWVLEAYLLLNQSSTASSEVTKPEALIADRNFAIELINKVLSRIDSKESLREIFGDNFSANLVLTAHPTAGIQPDYISHIKNMVETVQEIALRINPQDWQRMLDESLRAELELAIEDLLEDITLSVSHMVRAKPYNNEVLKPVDESTNFLNNLSEAWTIIPHKIQALERELKNHLGNDFRLNPTAFKIHSWVARDIDGNPTVSKEEHLKSIIQERLHFITKYRLELENLWQSLSDDFTNDPELPTKTFFRDENFKLLYNAIVQANPGLTNLHQAYRIVIENAIINRLDFLVDALMTVETSSAKGLKILQEFDIATDIILPLELIRANKEGQNTKEIDILIRKASIFGDYGSLGHTRQGNDTLAKLAKYLTSLWDGQIEAKTNFALRLEPDVKIKKLFAEGQPTKINYGGLKTKITLQYGADNPKMQERLLQTFDLLELSEYGAISRQIISMNQSFEDMLNVLTISKIIGAFKPAQRDRLPWSRLEIVPLTEQISDLRNSYQVTIDALTNPAWLQYLIAHEGRFVKMRGPSDSGKQNGFIASQWEMFRSKQFDTIVIRIFNAFLIEALSGDAFEKQAWQKIYYESLEPLESEALVINKAFEAFSKFFQSESFDKSLWALAYKELGLKEIRLVNFDGWGEPVERGGGLEFETTVRCTQPLGSLPYYERTLQGGGAQQLASGLRTRRAIQDFINGISEIGVKHSGLEKRLMDNNDSIESYSNVLRDSFILDPNFTLLMNKLVYTVRKALRTEVLGLDLEDDTLVQDEKVLRNYFRHVIKSPLVYLDLFNIASRPTSRSGSQIKEYLNQAEYKYSLDQLAIDLPAKTIVSILNDIRAIPYAAMFSLLGGNHVSFYGFDQVLSNTEKFGTGSKTMLEWIKYFLNSDQGKQEVILLKHMIDSLERGILTSDQYCYRKAHILIEKSINPNYDVVQDQLVAKLIHGEQSTLNFIASVNNYTVANSDQVKFDELMQADTDLRDLMIARRNDAAVPRLGIAIAMSKILKHTSENKLNPLDQKNIPVNLLDLLRKAFAAGASTFGNGCID